jgi:hypothetical protein
MSAVSRAVSRAAASRPSRPSRPSPDRGLRATDRVRRAGGLRGRPRSARVPATPSRRSRTASWHRSRRGGAAPGLRGGPRSARLPPQARPAPQGCRRRRPRRTERFSDARSPPRQARPGEAARRALPGRRRHARRRPGAGRSRLVSDSSPGARPVAERTSGNPADGPGDRGPDHASWPAAEPPGGPFPALRAESRLRPNSGSAFPYTARTPGRGTRKARPPPAAWSPCPLRQPDPRGGCGCEG